MTNEEAKAIIACDAIDMVTDRLELEHKEDGKGD